MCLVQISSCHRPRSLCASHIIWLRCERVRLDDVCCGLWVCDLVSAIARTMTTKSPFPLPEEFNAASYFVDRHIAEGRGDKVAIECGDRRVTYSPHFETVNQERTALTNLHER